MSSLPPPWLPGDLSDPSEDRARLTREEPGGWLDRIHGAIGALRRPIDVAAHYYGGDTSVLSEGLEPHPSSAGELAADALFPEEEARGSYLESLARPVVRETANLATDPLTYALGGAGKIPGLAGKAVGLGTAGLFVPGMAAGALHAGGEAYDTVKREGLSPSALEHATEAGVLGAFALGGARHALEHARSRAVETPSDQTVPALPPEDPYIRGVREAQFDPEQFGDQAAPWQGVPEAPSLRRSTTGTPDAVAFDQASMPTQGRATPDPISPERSSTPWDGIPVFDTSRMPMQGRASVPTPEPPAPEPVAEPDWRNYVPLHPLPPELANPWDPPAGLGHFRIVPEVEDAPRGDAFAQRQRQKWRPTPPAVEAAPDPFAGIDLANLEGSFPVAIEGNKIRPSVKPPEPGNVTLPGHPAPQSKGKRVPYDYDRAMRDLSALPEADRPEAVDTFVPDPNYKTAKQRERFQTYTETAAEIRAELKRRLAGGAPATPPAGGPPSEWEERPLPEQEPGVTEDDLAKAGRKPLPPATDPYDIEGSAGPAPGMVRLYRGETTEDVAQERKTRSGSPDEEKAGPGRWFTENRDAAEQYGLLHKDVGKAPFLGYVDVPAEVAQRYKMPSGHYFLPEETARRITRERDLQPEDVGTPEAPAEAARPEVIGYRHRGKQARPGHVWVREGANVTQRKLEDVTPKDVRGHTILPEDEHLNPEERDALVRQTEIRAEEVARRHRQEGAPSRTLIQGTNGVEGAVSSKSAKYGGPFEGLPDTPAEILAGVRRDKGNPIERRAREAVLHNDPDFQEVLERSGRENEQGDASFNPEDFEPPAEPARPVAPRPNLIENTKAGKQAVIPGSIDATMARPIRTEGRETEGPLFTQERDARDRAEVRSQGGLFDESAPTNPSAAKAGPVDIGAKMSDWSRRIKAGEGAAVEEAQAQREAIRAHRQNVAERMDSGRSLSEGTLARDQKALIQADDLLRDIGPGASTSATPETPARTAPPDVEARLRKLARITGKDPEALIRDYLAQEEESPADAARRAEISKEADREATERAKARSGERKFSVRPREDEHDSIFSRAGVPSLKANVLESLRSRDATAPANRNRTGKEWLRFLMAKGRASEGDLRETGLGRFLLDHQGERFTPAAMREQATKGLPELGVDVVQAGPGQPSFWSNEKYWAPGTTDREVHVVKDGAGDLFHVALSTRERMGGRRYLIVNEVQSERFQRTGYQHGTPGPFAKTWEDAAIKYAVQYAKENDFDGVFLAPKEVQNARYGSTDVGQRYEKLVPILGRATNVLPKRAPIIPGAHDYVGVDLDRAPDRQRVKYDIGAQRPGGADPARFNAAVQRELRGLRYEVTPEGVDAMTPSGQRISVSRTGQITWAPEEVAKRHGEATVEKMKAGEAGPVGVTVSDGRDFVVQVVDEGVLPHEIAHVFLDGFATDSEAKYLRKRYAGQAETEGRNVDETIADAYRDWRKGRETPQVAKTVFQRLLGWFKKLGGMFKDTRNEGIFEKVESGEAFQRTGGGSPVDGGPKFSVRPIPPGAKPGESSEPPTPTKGAKFFEYYINGMLSGPASPIAKGISDAASLSWGAVSRGVSGALESGVSKAQGRASERSAVDGIAHLQGMRDTFPEAIGNFVKAWKEENTPGVVGGDATEQHPGAIGGTAGKIVRAPSRIFRAIDAFSKTLASGAERRVQAFRLATSEGGSEAQIARRTAEITAAEGPELERLVGKEKAAQITNAAKDYQKRATFQDDFGPNMKKLDEVRRDTPLKYAIPFMRVPWNLAKAGYRGTPMNFVNILAKIHSGELQGAAVSDALAAPIMGTLTMLAVAAKARAGELSGSGPDDKKERQALQASGWQPYSVKIGDQWISYKRIEPIATIIGLAADAVESKNEKNGSNLVKKAATAIEQAFTHKTFISGLEQVGAAFQDPAQFGESYIRSLEGGIVPNVLAKATAALDPVQRDVNAFRVTRHGIPEAIAARIPGLSQTVGPKYNGLGQESPRLGSDETAVERFASPFTRSKQADKPVEEALARTGWTPKAPDRAFTLPPLAGKPAQRAQLTDEELAVYEDADRKAAVSAERLAKSPGFARLPATEEEGGSRSQEAQMRALWSKFRAEARQKLIPKVARRLRAEA